MMPTSIMNTHEITYLTQSMSSSQTLYLIHQLVENHNHLVTHLQDTESRFHTANKRLLDYEAEKDYLLAELSKKEIANERMKLLINKASTTIAVTEQDYNILQRQVEILTKKMTLLVEENTHLSLLAHHYHLTSSSVTSNNNNSNNNYHASNSVRHS